VKFYPFRNFFNLLLEILACERETYNAAVQCIQVCFFSLLVFHFLCKVIRLLELIMVVKHVMLIKNVVVLI